MVGDWPTCARRVDCCLSPLYLSPRSSSGVSLGCHLLHEPLDHAPAGVQGPLRGVN